MSAPVLSAMGLSKRFGGITATDNVALALAPGARHALIGPNGAGKTTLVNLLTGVLEPSAGSISPSSPIAQRSSATGGSASAISGRTGRRGTRA